MCREMQRQIPAREAYSMSKTVSGTRCHQSFVSMYPRRGSGTRNAAALCNDICTKILLGDSNTELDTLPKTVLAGSNNFEHGNYIACNVRPGMVHREHFKHPDEHNDAYVNFMNTILSWAQKSVLNPFQDILCIISAPEQQRHGSHQYILSSTTNYDGINALLPTFLNKL